MDQQNQVLNTAGTARGQSIIGTHSLAELVAASLGR